MTLAIKPKKYYALKFYFYRDDKNKLGAGSSGHHLAASGRRPTHRLPPTDTVASNCQTNLILTASAITTRRTPDTTATTSTATTATATTTTFTSRDTHQFIKCVVLTRQIQSPGPIRLKG